MLQFKKSIISRLMNYAYIFRICLSLSIRMTFAGTKGRKHIQKTQPMVFPWFWVDLLTYCKEILLTLEWGILFSALLLRFDMYRQGYILPQAASEIQSHSTDVAVKGSVWPSGKYMVTSSFFHISWDGIKVLQQSSSHGFSQEEEQKVEQKVQVVKDAVTWNIVLLSCILKGR